jgi:glycerol-3-phosphate dehydrogenase
MEASWNARHRAEALAEAAAREYDLVIVGGGINGAGLAREAALRGFSFCLVDKNDFAFGTSSRSSKMVHGGMRYISQGELALVRKSETERNWLRCQFPNLVRPAPFFYCAFERGKDRPSHVYIGLAIYHVLSDWFSRFKNVRRPRFLTAAELARMEPAFTARDPGLGRVRVAGLYYDTNVDDARLTIETIKDGLAESSAPSVALNYARVTGFLRDAKGRVNGVDVTDELGGGSIAVRASAVAVCAGVWTDEVMKGTALNDGKIRPTKGAHIVVPNTRLGNNASFGIRSFDDGRFFFVLRRGEYTVIGTTDTDYCRESGDLDDPRCTKSDCDYLLATVNRLFPAANLGYEDILGAYAGIRPLIKRDDAENESAVSRGHEIFESADGVFAIAGGKLTTYRLMSEELLLRMARRGAIRPFTMKAHRRAGFSRRPFKVGVTREEFDVEVSSRGLAGAMLPEQMEILHRQYGRGGLDILEAVRGRPEAGKALIEDYPLCRAEVEFILEHEMAPRLADLLCRRTEAQWQVPPRLQPQLAAKTAAIMAEFYGWDEGRMRTEIQHYMEYEKDSLWF